VSEGDIRKLLLDKGQGLFDAPPQKPIIFTHVKAANLLLSDLERYSHAFVLACVMDRQMKAELAWLIPHRLEQKLEGFAFPKLAQLSLSDWGQLMRYPEPLHRFPDLMAENLFHAVRRLELAYGGDASRIWEGRPASATVVYRFLEFQGVGPKIATMAANILARDFKIPLSDHYSIDVSVDRHVRRVFIKLGLVPDDATDEKIIYRARSLSPEYPGLLDLPSWEIGRNWCHPHDPDCAACYMRRVCPSSVA